MTNSFKDAKCVVINKGYNPIPKEIKDKTIVIDSDIKEIINELK